MTHFFDILVIDLIFTLTVRKKIAEERRTKKERQELEFLRKIVT